MGRQKKEMRSSPQRPNTDAPDEDASRNKPEMGA